MKTSRRSSRPSRDDGLVALLLALALGAVLYALALGKNTALAELGRLIVQAGAMGLAILAALRLH